MTSEPTGARDMVGKALTLLQVLGDYPHGAKLSELSAACQYPASTTYRLLNSLREQGFTQHGANKRWELGLRLYELGHRVSHRRGFSGVAIPEMERVSARTGEPTLFAVLDRDENMPSMVYVHTVGGKHRLQIHGETGRRGPLHCTSMGKCLLAFHSRSERHSLVDKLTLERHTQRTITTKHELNQHLDEVFAQGYAVADQEHEMGIVAVGVPVLDPHDCLLGSLSIAAPLFRASTEALISDYLPHLKNAAAQLAALLPRR